MDGFTSEQDAELLRRKTENQTWEEVVEAMGKEKKALTQRFGQIKPKGWKPNPVDKGKGKKDNKAGNETKQGDDKDKKDADAGGPSDGQNQRGKNGKNGKNDKNDKDGDKTLQRGGPSNSGNNNNGGGGGNNNGNNNANNNANNNNANNNNANNNNNNNNSGNAGPGGSDIREISPDETFSMEDLIIISKILKRDHRQIWFRVQCAFRDRTGRYVPEDAFRDKFTKSGN